MVVEDVVNSLASKAAHYIDAGVKLTLLPELEHSTITVS